MFGEDRRSTLLSSQLYLLLRLRILECRFALAATSPPSPLTPLAFSIAAVCVLSSPLRPLSHSSLMFFLGSIPSHLTFFFGSNLELVRVVGSTAIHREGVGCGVWGVGYTIMLSSSGEPMMLANSLLLLLLLLLSSRPFSVAKAADVQPRLAKARIRPTTAPVYLSKYESKQEFGRIPRTWIQSSVLSEVWAWRM